MKRVIIAEKRQGTWKSVLDVENYNMEAIRRNNVTVEAFQKWLEVFDYFSIDVGLLDINLYAIEFAMRTRGRYGSRLLPKVPGNPFSEMRYYFLLNQYEGLFSNEERREMLLTIIKRTSPATLEKWLAPEGE